VVVQPETVLRWHRAGFRLFWRRRSRPRKASPLPSETIDLIRDMAARGRLWGAERIRGELLKLGIKVSKRTIQKYMRGVRNRGGGGQSWATFLKNHAERMWGCDFIQTHDLWFRQVYALFFVHLASRRVVHVAATRHPTQAWTAQQLRNATMDGDAPAVLLRDRDDKFGAAFDRAAQGVGIKVIRTAVRAPNYEPSWTSTRPSRSRSRACSAGFTSTTAGPLDSWRSCRTTSVASTGLHALLPEAHGSPR
jgi:hypothetical protein